MIILCEPEMGLFAFRSFGTRINPGFKTVKSVKTTNISPALDFAVLNANIYSGRSAHFTALS